MRITLFILMIAYSCVLRGQYISGLAPENIDAYVTLVEDQYRVSDLKAPKLASDKLLAYWQEQKNKATSDAILKNYYYALTQNIQLKNELGLISKDSTDFVLTIESDLKKQLPNDWHALAHYYYVVSKLQRKVFKNAELRETYLKKALELCNKNEKQQTAIKLRILNSLGGTNRIARNYDEARSYLNESLSLNQQLTRPDTVALINALYELGATSYYQGDFEAGSEIAMKGYDLATGYLDEDHRKISLFGRQVGLMYSATGNFQKSLEFAERMLATQKEDDGKKKKGIAKFYSSISSIQQRLGDIRTANVYIDSAIMYAERDTERALLPGYIHNKALITDDSDKAIQLYKRAYELCEADTDCPIANKSIMLQNLGNEYYVSGNLQKGLNYITQSRIIKENNYKTLGAFLPSTYGSLALISSTLGDIGKAIEYQTLSLKTVREFRPAGSFFVGTELARLGRFYREADRLDEAEQSLKEALHILENSAGKKNEQTILTYRYLSELYRAKDQNIVAISYAKKSLAAAKSFGLNPASQLKLIADSYTSESMLDSAKVYMNLILEESGVDLSENDSSSNSNEVSNPWRRFVAYMNYLIVEDRIYGDEQTQIIEKINKGIEIIDNLRSDFFFKSSEQGFQRSSRDFFNWSLHKLSSRYEQNGSDDILDLMFQCIEKSKSITINRNFVRRNSIWEGDIPEDILKKEKRIIEDYSTIYDKYKQAVEGDSLKNVYAQQMYDLELQREEFLQLLETEYSDYYNNRYDQSISVLEEAKAIAAQKNLGIVMIHWGDSLIHRFVIAPDYLDYSAIDTKDIEQDLIQLEQILNDQETNGDESNFIKTQSTFIKSSNKIYFKLFSKTESDKLPFDLLIIPDGRLVKLPFEVLVKEPYDKEDNYRSLSYLMRDHAISYAGTATEFINYNITNNRRNENLYGGFAPLYNIDTTLLLQDSSKNRRSEISPLLYNIEEVQRSADLFDGDVYLGSEASEDLFIERSQGYRILHLAMHTSLNDQFPMESYLNFSQEAFRSDSISREGLSYDGQLQVNEIAKMNLNSDLVVLSACETNYGEDYLGEGVLGIARAFQLASCSNMVLSNWLVDDRSSSKIIYSFFNHLFNDESPSHALRKAKIEFLESSAVSYSHPKYWAAFSYYGNMEELDFNTKSSSSSNLKLLFLLSSIILLIACRFIFFRK